MNLKFLTVAALFTITGLAAQTDSTMKPINTNAPATTSQSIIINASPEKVWQILANINNWPAWQPNVSKAALKDSLKVGVNFNWKADGFTIHSSLHTVQPGQYLGWTGKTMGLYAIHNWTFESVPEGTRVTVDESMEGLLARLFKKMVTKNLEKSITNVLTYLKAESEK